MDLYYNDKCDCSAMADVSQLSMSLPVMMTHNVLCKNRPLVQLLPYAKNQALKLSRLENRLSSTSASSFNVSLPGRDSASGVYILRSDKLPLAVWKPLIEECGSKHAHEVARSYLNDTSSGNVFPPDKNDDDYLLDSPERRSPSHSLSDLDLVLGRNSEGFAPGEGAGREVAAYILDKLSNGFIRVPETGLAAVDVESNNKHGSSVFNGPGFRATNTKMAAPVIGAIQLFVENVGDVDDFGPSVFDSLEVQKIAAFDIRVLNCDRHGGNILVELAREKTETRYKLRPIDHGYILPSSIHCASWPIWMDWPQVKQQVHPQVLEYVEQIDLNKEIKALEGLLQPAQYKTLELSTIMLQQGLRQGMTLYEIGLLVFSRNPNKDISFLERRASRTTQYASREVSCRSKDEQLVSDMQAFLKVPSQSGTFESPYSILSFAQDEEMHNEWDDIKTQSSLIIDQLKEFQNSIFTPEKEYKSLQRRVIEKSTSHKGFKNSNDSNEDGKKNRADMLENKDPTTDKVPEMKSIASEECDLRSDFAKECDLLAEFANPAYAFTYL